MANKFRVDLDHLSHTARRFTEGAEELRALLADADAAVDALRTTKWNSQASAAFFSSYSSAWKMGFQEHIEAARFLGEQLRYADNAYKKLNDSATALADSLVE